jgi:hypothetical protein
MDDIIIPNIYKFSNYKFSDIYSKLPLLKTIEFHFHDNKYDIIINNEKYNNNDNSINFNKRTSLLTFYKLFKEFNYNIRINILFYIKTNCNNLLSYIHYSDGSNYDNYDLFDGFIGSLDYKSEIVFFNKKIKFDKISDKYVKIYLYYIKKSISNIYITNYTSNDRIYYMTNSKIDLSYFIINGINLNKTNLNCDNTIINIKLLNIESLTDKSLKYKPSKYQSPINQFNLVCICNILYDLFDDMILIFTPIKIIDNNNLNEINIFNTCNNCNYCNYCNIFNTLNKKNMKYYSKFTLNYITNYKKIQNNLSLLIDYEPTFIIDVDNLLLILKNNYGINLEIKYINMIELIINEIA